MELLKDSKLNITIKSQLLFSSFLFSFLLSVQGYSAIRTDFTLNLQLLSSETPKINNVFSIFSRLVKKDSAIIQKPGDQDKRAHTVSYFLAWPPYPATYSPIAKSRIGMDVFPIHTIDFNYFNRNSLKLGISFSSYDAFSSDTFYVSPLTNPYDKISITSLQILLSIDYRYINKPKLNLYSGFALGYCLTIREGAHSASSNGIKYQYIEYTYSPAWQINFLGMNYFPVKWFGFSTEIGYGYGGIVKGGIVYRFLLR